MSEPSVKVFITHAPEDDARSGPVLEMLDAWDVDYFFDRHPGAIEKLSGRVQKALGDSRLLLRICTRNTSRSYKMSLETGGFITIQAQDHREGGQERREIINLVLDSEYQREPFDFTSAILDATQAHATGWVNDLRRALGLDPLSDDDAAAVARRMTYRPQVSRRRTLVLGAAGAVTLAAAAAGGTAFIIESRSSGPRATPTPTPRTTDPQLVWYTPVCNVDILGDKGVIRQPLVFGSAIYTTALDGTFSAIDPATGKIRWQKRLGASMYSAPVGDNGHVYAFWNGGLYAFDARSGQQVWQYQQNAEGGSPTTLTVASGRLYVTWFGAARTFLVAIDASTGQALFGEDVSGSLVPPAPVSLPTIQGNVCYIGASDGYLYALDLANHDSPLIWKAEAGAAKALKLKQPQPFWVTSRPAAANGVVYVGSTDNSLYALDAQTGAKRWSFETSDQIDRSGPAVANGVVYVGSDDKSLYALDAQTGSLLWRYETGDKIQSSPVVAGGIVYIGSRDTYIHAVNAQTGLLVRKYKTGAEVIADPVIANDTIYAGALDGYLYAFRV